MYTSWQQFLTDQGAEHESGRLAHFGNPDRERRILGNADALADLSHIDLVDVRGDDAASFLQGQLGNDVLKVDDQHGQISSYASAKGRAYAVFQVLKRPDGFRLLIAGGVTETLVKRLRMFVLRADVTIEPANEAHQRIGLAGPRAVEELAEALNVAADQLPSEPWGCATFGAVQALRLPGTVPRFVLIVSALEDACRIWAQCNVRMAPVGQDAWDLGDILAGMPIVTPATSETFVPQMINLGALGGISFEKGCYPGQEVVARMHYLGKLKRAMLRFAATSVDPPQPGDAVFTDGESAQEVGTVVRAAMHPDERFALLVVLQLAHADAPLRLGRPDGPQLTRVAMPYALPESA